MELIFALVITAFLLTLGLTVGGAVERAHLRRLDLREQQLSNIVISDMKRLPVNWYASDATLVTGEAVIATDYFKVFAASLRKLFGGEIRSLETLVQRARREAVVRMLDQAQAAGANVVWNVRLQTTTIQGKQQNQAGGVEVLAYGTAMRVVGQE